MTSMNVSKITYKTSATIMCKIPHYKKIVTKSTKSKKTKIFDGSPPQRDRIPRYQETWAHTTLYKYFITIWQVSKIPNRYRCSFINPEFVDSNEWESCNTIATTTILNQNPLKKGHTTFLFRI